MAQFPSLLAVSEDGSLLPGAEGHIYSVNDLAAATPLTVTDLSGIPFPGNVVTASATGVLPPFRVAGEAVVAWVSGPHRMDIPSMDLIPRGGSVGQVLTKASPADFDFSWGTVAAGPGGGSGGGSMIPAYESGGTYIRPTSDPDICVVFTGVTDPGPVALENDRWERLS